MKKRHERKRRQRQEINERRKIREEEGKVEI
jgi:hypothetical protein